MEVYLSALMQAFEAYSLPASSQEGEPKREEKTRIGSTKPIIRGLRPITIIQDIIRIFRTFSKKHCAVFLAVVHRVVPYATPPAASLTH